MLSNEYFNNFFSYFNGMDFSTDAEGNCTSQELNRRLSKAVEDIEKSAVQIADTIYIDKNQKEDGVYFNSPFLQFGYFFLSFTTDTANYILQRRDQLTHAESIINKLAGTCFTLFQELLCLKTLGANNGIVSSFRSLYEAFISLRILIENPQLASTFEDHARWNHLRLRIAHTKKSESKALASEKESIERKYSQSFCSSYGWVYSMLSRDKDQISLQELVDHLGLQEFNQLYKITCECDHASSFVVRINDDQNDFIEHVFKASLYLHIEAFLNHLGFFSSNDHETIIISSIVSRLRVHAI